MNMFYDNNKFGSNVSSHNMKDSKYSMNLGNNYLNLN